MAGGRPSRSAEFTGRTEPTDLECKVLEVMKPHVKIAADHLGPHTNVFECGMDSLAVARLSADLRRTFGVQVTPAQIMQRPAASLILDQFTSAIREELEGVYHNDSVDALLPPFPHVVMRLASETSIDGLQAAWKDLATHHEMLRTVFHFGSELVQVVLRPHAIQWQFPRREVQGVSDAAFQSHFTSDLGPSIAREINSAISRTPPVQLSFFVAPEPSMTYMVLSIHHALYDGISLPVLLEDLERAYGQQQQLPSAPLRAIVERIVTIDQSAAREFWTSHLEGFPWQRLLNKSASSSTADVTSVAFKHSFSQLQSKAAERHVTLQALLMSAYGYLLGHRLYDYDDVVFGVIRAGRSLPIDNIDTTICPMITVVPARIRFGASESVLQVVQRDIARVSEFEHIPLSRIQKWVPEGGGSLFDTLFSVSFKQHDRSSLWSVIESQNPEPDYILAVEVVLDPEQNQIVAHAAYTPEDISSTIVSEILQRLEETAIQLVEDAISVPNLARARELRSLPQVNGSHPDERASIRGHVEADELIVATICALASQFLRVNPDLVTGDTSLLSLGLDSIKSVGLSRRLAKEGLRLSSADIMGLGTPRRLAARIQEFDDSAKQSQDPASASFTAECEFIREAIDPLTIKLSAEDDVQAFPTTTLQAGMLSQTVSSGGRLYVHLFPLRLAKDVNVSRLRGAWEEAVSSLDILRTSFHFLPGPGRWAAAVHSIGVLHWSESAYEASANLAESLNPFLRVSDESEFFREPPVYLNLLKAMNPDESDLLVVVLHHALYDGLSIAKLLHSVQRLYSGLGTPVGSRFYEVLPQLLWQEKHGTDFWVERLKDLHAAPIPRKPSVVSATVFQASRRMDITSEELGQACRHAEVTPQCLGQAAFAKLLAILTRSPDVVFGRVVSGRDVPGTEEVIGPMLNTLPCRVSFAGERSNKALLQNIHQHNVASMAWQHVSLRSIHRRLGVSSLWDSLFVFQPRQESFESEADRLWTFDAGNPDEISVQYALNLELHEEANGYVVQVACTSEVADAEELKAFVDRYVQLLSTLIHRLDDFWSSDVPEIPTMLAKGPVEAPKAVNGQNVDEWDKSLAAFRDVIASVAKVPSSSVHLSTPLAALGIDSISAVQLVAKAKRSGFRLTSSDVVQSRTVDALLARLKEIKASMVICNTHLVSIDIPRDRWLSLLFPDVERIVHASPGMEWMLGMWQRSEGSRFQHVFGYRLPAHIDNKKLRNAWMGLIRRHAILRSTFVHDRVAGTPRLLVFKPEALDSSWSEDTLEPSDRELEDVVARMKAQVSNPRPVSRPITRAVLLCSEGSLYLLIHLHHFQYDAWSLQLIIDDLTRLYEGEEPRSSNDLDSFLRSVVLTPEAEKVQRSYWRSTLAAMPVPALLPPMPNAPMVPERYVYTNYAALSDAAKLEKLSRELSVSLQNILLASWAQVQSKYAQSDVATFSLWHSGRTGDVKDIERLAVPCINSLPYSVSGVNVDTLTLARRIQADLQARTALIEQSRLVRVHEWLGATDKPLSNVYVNIIKVAPEVQKNGEMLMEPIEAPYYIPRVPSNAAGIIDRMGITDLVKDDVMIDIAVLGETDKVAMSIEATAAVLDKTVAKSLIEQWASLVRECLT
ncbi:hypothetical protein BN946_scf184785.g4 [Trametes cinnabarina]|uniref:Carrier domain-containing protein n=1 Tax=Pycnoporus cinnabarinus TaxID=5643 RepID=A0A060SB37_PYCCI|nr:hypothetical protein BN946_scf184785.g4 [Trametes cinnabarina]